MHQTTLLQQTSVSLQPDNFEVVYTFSIHILNIFRTFAKKMPKSSKKNCLSGASNNDRIDASDKPAVLPHYGAMEAALINANDAAAAESDPILAGPSGLQPNMSSRPARICVRR